MTSVYGLIVTCAHAPRQVAAVLSEATRTKLHATFEELDLDHRGTIDVEDMVPILKSFEIAADADHMLTVADEDEDGELDCPDPLEASKQP